MIEIRELVFGYPHGKRVFDGLDFSVRRGERVGLVGPNGAGKSTLMHLVMGLLEPWEGEIRVLGTPRRREKDFHEVRRRVGLLFQDSDDQLFCPTVEEDIAFGPLNLGKSHAEAREIVRQCCGLLGLDGQQKALTHKLSGGEKRLVALASVAAMRPECLLLDEPAAGLDEQKTALLLRYLREYADTYVIASHDRDLLAAATDRVFRITPPPPEGEGAQVAHPGHKAV
jgi:cobalt/nickel transport system ATP-binding protein